MLGGMRDSEPITAWTLASHSQGPLPNLPTAPQVEHSSACQAAVPCIQRCKEEELEIYLLIPHDMEISDQLLSRLDVKHRRDQQQRLVKNLYGLKQTGRL
jgi:hypothetical protein